MVLAIISILASLMLPAIQKSREAARTITCRNNLKQLGLAIQSYYDTHQCFPMASGRGDSANFQGGRRHSGFVGMLPYMGYGSLYKTIKNGGYEASVDGSVDYEGFRFAPWDSNHKAVRMNMPDLLCPSDGTSLVQPLVGKTSYAFSRGDSAWDHNPSWSGNGDRGLRGVFVGGNRNTIGGRKISDITDGISNTIAMSERITAKSGGNSIRTGATAVKTFQYEYIVNPSVARTRVEDNGVYIGETRRWSGVRWTDGCPSYTGMTTILGPNSPSVTQGYWDCHDGIFEPTSHHPGGVQTLMVDGSVTMINEKIDTGDPTKPSPINGPSPYGVWGALGSINGGETVEF